MTIISQPDINCHIIEFERKKTVNIFQFTVS